MNSEDIGLPPHLQRMVNAGISGLDIMHGELKNLMLMAENNLSDALHGDGYEYKEGVLNTLVELYNLTYDLSFAIGARDDN
jgi:hypothetical protein